MNLTRRSLLHAAIVAAIALSATGYAGGDKSTKNRPNGDIIVKDRATNNSNLTTVNGHIEVGEGASVANVKVVTGSIEIRDSARANHVKIVTGDIEIGTDCKIAGEVGAVTGDVRVRERTSLAQGVRVVTGDIKLDGKNNAKSTITAVTGDVEIGPDSKIAAAVTTVTGAISIQGPTTIRRAENVSGDVNLDRTTIEKDLRLRKPKGGSSLADKVDTIRIGPGTVIKGDLVAERPIKLLVHTSAKIEGDIEGATAEPYGE